VYSRRNEVTWPLRPVWRDGPRPRRRSFCPLSQRAGRVHKYASATPRLEFRHWNDLDRNRPYNRLRGSRAADRNAGSPRMHAALLQTPWRVSGRLPRKASFQGRPRWPVCCSSGFGHHVQGGRRVGSSGQPRPGRCVIQFRRVPARLSSDPAREADSPAAKSGEIQGEA